MVMKLGRVVIRADASATIGTGHLMRCLALAQAIADIGGDVIFVCREIPDPLSRRLMQERFQVRTLLAKVASDEDAAQTAATAAAEGADWVIVDGYRFAPEYYERVRQARIPVMAIDDMAHQASYPVDLLLNQNLHAVEASYRGRTGSGTTLLLGPKFSLLRREFRNYGTWQRQAPPRVRRILVSFGGSDPQNVTARALESLAETSDRDFEVVVLIGAANPAVVTLQQQSKALPFTCEVRANVDDVAGVMAWADAAVTAGGSTVWELASMRLPSLVVTLSVDQRIGLNALGAMPLFRVRDVADFGKLDVFAELSGLIAELLGHDLNDSSLNRGIDANGAARVRDAMAEARRVD